MDDGTVIHPGSLIPKIPSMIICKFDLFFCRVKRIFLKNLKMLLRTLSVYERVSIARPWSTGFLTCAAKGLAADLLIQCAVEKKEEIDWKRAGVFSFYVRFYVFQSSIVSYSIKKIQGGWYCGWFQHGLYNIVYHRIFGASTQCSSVEFQKENRSNTNARIREWYKTQVRQSRTRFGKSRSIVYFTFLS